jgi:hypothetical protein
LRKDGEKQERRSRVGAMKKVKISAILFSVLLVGCFASTRSSKLRADLDGFRDVKWGTELSTLKDMEKVESGRASNPDLVWYTRKGDLLTIGRAKLESIFYSFWMGAFEGVWIGFEGDENFETLKKELFERFGKVLESEELMKRMEGEAGREPSTVKHAEEFYAWWGEKMEMTLSYSKSRHQGTLLINSKKISEERRAFEKQKRK